MRVGPGVVAAGSGQDPGCSRGKVSWSLGSVRVLGPLVAAGSSDSGEWPGTRLVVPEDCQTSVTFRILGEGGPTPTWCGVVGWVGDAAVCLVGPAWTDLWGSVRGVGQESSTWPVVALQFGCGS